MKKALVLTSIPLNNVGGVEKVNLHLMNLLESEGWQVTHISEEDFIPLVSRLFKDKTFSLLERSLQAALNLNWQDFDLVVTNNLAGGACFDTPKTKVLTWVHGVLMEAVKVWPDNECPIEIKNKRYLSVVEGGAYRGKSVLISVSEQISNDLLQHYGLPSNAINNPIDTNRFKVSADKNLHREYFKIPRNKLVALYCGRWSLLEKRPDVILSLAEVFKDVIWVFATDIEACQFKQLVPENVIFLNNVPYKEIHRLYACANFCVQPSLYESFSNFALESIASGVPIVSTPVGIVNELYLNNPMDDLLVAQAGDKEELRKNFTLVIDKLLQDIDQYQHEAVRLSVRIGEDYSLASWEARVMKIVNEIFDEN